MLNSQPSNKINVTGRAFFSGKPAAKPNGDENKVNPINTAELEAASASPGAFMLMLKENRAPMTIFRVSDTQLRNFHSNVRAAVEIVEASSNKEALITEMRNDTKLPKKSTVRALVLYTLGHYDLKKNKEGKRPDGYFWSRDQGVQSYLAENNVSASETSEKIRSLRGVHLTYTTWTSTRKPSASASSKSRPSFLKAVRDAVHDVEEGAEVVIRARVEKSGKLSFIRASIADQ